MKLLTPSNELISNYGYKSKLSPNEQRILLNSKAVQIYHNPNLLLKKLQNNIRPVKNQVVSKELLEKQKIESFNYNKCAEIFYQRNPLSIEMNNDMKSFLISRWTKISSKRHNQRFQVITAVQRDQICNENVEMIVQRTIGDDFRHEAYLISEENFPALDRSMLKEELFDLKYSNVTNNNSSGAEISLSLDLLTKLFSKDEQFSVMVENCMNSMGRMCATFNEPVPLTSRDVALTSAIEEIVRNLLQLSIDWYNIDNIVKQKPEDVSTKSWSVKTVDGMMTKSYALFKKKAGSNQIQRLWNLSIGAQNIEVLVGYSDVYFIRNEHGALIPANVSVKLEYQTKFGAEKMSRDELFKEWIRQKLNPGSVTIRFRIDPVSLTIVSISWNVTTGEIEKSLYDLYGIKPNDSMLGNVAIVFGVFKRSPAGEYMVETKIEGSSNSISIYKASEDGTRMSDNQSWTISNSFSRPWMPIDDSTPTFLHQNHSFAPCCFPHINGKHQLSYSSSPVQNQIKKVSKSPVKKSKRLQRKKGLKNLQS